MYLNNLPQWMWRSPEPKSDHDLIWLTLNCDHVYFCTCEFYYIWCMNWEKYFRVWDEHCVPKCCFVQTKLWFVIKPDIVLLSMRFENFGVYLCIHDPSLSLKFFVEKVYKPKTIDCDFHFSLRLMMIKWWTTYLNLYFLQTYWSCNAMYKLLNVHKFNWYIFT